MKGSEYWQGRAEARDEARERDASWKKRAKSAEARIERLNERLYDEEPWMNIQAVLDLHWKKGLYCANCVGEMWPCRTVDVLRGEK